jgi:hypothetical protein
VEEGAGLVRCFNSGLSWSYLPPLCLYIARLFLNNINRFTKVTHTHVKAPTNDSQSNGLMNNPPLRQRLLAT